SGTTLLAGPSSSSLPLSTSCIAAVPVMAFVIDAIHTTVSSVIEASLPSSRLPKAPSYNRPLSVAAMAMMPGIVLDSTACANALSTLLNCVISFPPTRESRGLGTCRVVARASPFSGGQRERHAGPFCYLSQLRHQVVRNRDAMLQALRPGRHLGIAGDQHGLI